MKKGELVGDRCLRFCELFVRQAVDKGRAIHSAVDAIWSSSDDWNMIQMRI